MPGLFLINGDQLEPMDEAPYETEDVLQALIARFPALLADGPDTTRLMLVSREVGVPGEDGGGGRWSLDHLFLDSDGIPTLVEVKRSTDTRIRREVVGQMLDYAANAVRYWPPESIRTNFEEECQRRGNDPDLELAKCIGEEMSAEQFWESVKRNLQAGKIRMIFVADVIPDELASIVEFLNEQMDPAEVLAVELRRFRTGTTEALSPRLVGRTEEAKHRKGTSVRPKRKWDEASFFQVLDAKRMEQAEVARALLQWAKANATRIWWGEGATSGSFIPLLVHASDQHQLFGVYNGGENGQACIEIHFQYLARHKPFSDIELRRELLNRLNNLPGISISEGRIEGRPSVPLSTLQDQAVRTQFVQVLDWVAQQIRNCPPNE